MKVSIVIPCYNENATIRKIVEAVRAAPIQSKEIIIVDDGSRDQTRRVARQFGSGEISVVVQENQGAAAARNNAFKLCQGDYIQWLDADDLLSPDKIAK